MAEQSFSYLFQSEGKQISLVVSVTTPATNGTGYGNGYSVQTIGGFIGSTVIDGEYGVGGQSQDDPSGFSFNNTIFASPGTGHHGNMSGIDDDGLEFTAGGRHYEFYTGFGNYYLFNETDGKASILTLISTNAPCFVCGTTIRSTSGARAVETLAIGDLVLTADGIARPVKWMGHRTIDPVATRFANPDAVMPIRIRAGALGDSLPVRDLLLSPDHAVLIEGVLVQAGALVNGTTVVRETRSEPFTYWHVELADHALILAEGVAAETFVSNVTRMGFDNWDEHQVLYGNKTETAEMETPRVQSARQLPQRVRRVLAERVRAMGRDAEAAALVAA